MSQKRYCGRCLELLDTEITETLDGVDYLICLECGNEVDLVDVATGTITEAELRKINKGEAELFKILEAEARAEIEANEINNVINDEAVERFLRLNRFEDGEPN